MFFGSRNDIVADDFDAVNTLFFFNFKIVSCGKNMF